MTGITGWIVAYGSTDGTWLMDEFHRITKDVPHIEHIRIARTDNAEEMARYRDEVDATGRLTTGDWELASPTTGVAYTMGCDWHD